MQFRQSKNFNEKISHKAIQHKNQTKSHTTQKFQTTQKSNKNAIQNPNKTKNPQNVRKKSRQADKHINPKRKQFSAGTCVEFLLCPTLASQKQNINKQERSSWLAPPNFWRPIGADS